MIRVLLDGEITAELPKGLDDLIDSIKTDRSLRVRYPTQDGNLTFYDQGYTYIKSVFDKGFCNEISIIIQEDNDDQAWEDAFKGIIHIPACEFGIAPEYVKCQLDDDGYLARIFKNKGIKYLLTSDRSKNDYPIIPAAYDEVEFFTPSTGDYDYTGRWVFPIFETLKFLIAAMSDGEVGIESGIFDAGGLYQGVGIILGAELRAGPTNSHDKQPEISFNEFMDEISKKYDLMLEPRRDQSGNPYLKIERRIDFYTDPIDPDDVVSLDYVRDIKHTIDTNKLYAYIKAGSDKTDDSSGAVQFPETTRWVGFKEEQYPLLGQCNEDVELDTLSSYIISSNIIEQIVVNNITDYDKDIVIVEYDRSALTANQSNWLSTPTPYFYNEGLQNSKVVERYLEGIPSSIANFLGTDSDDRFIARPNQDRYDFLDVGGSGSIPTGVFYNNDFTDPGFDTNNNYGNGTSQGTLIPGQSYARYTAAQGGSFRFSSRYHATIHHHDANSSISLILTAKRFNSGGSLISSQTFTYGVPNNIVSDYEYSREKDFVFLLNSTDYVTTEWKWGLQNLSLHKYLIYTTRKDSDFKCIWTSYGGGVWATVDQADFDGHVFKFRHRMDKATFSKIKSKPSEAIFFNTDGTVNYKGWVDQATFYRGRGYADFTITSRQRLLP